MRKIILVFLLLLVVILTSCQPRDISTVLNEGYDIIGINEEWEDAGCILHINSDLLIEMEVFSNNIDFTTPGEYQVVYYAEYGNEEYTCLRIVKVIDEESPLISLNPGIDTILVGEEWEDAGVTVTDNLDESPTIVVTGTVNNNIVGSYEITYTVTDDFFNTTVITRIVNVIE